MTHSTNIPRTSQLPATGAACGAAVPLGTARSYAHHYGAVRRVVAPERKLRVYAPLAWCVLPHVRRSERLETQRERMREHQASKRRAQHDVHALQGSRRAPLPL